MAGRQPPGRAAPPDGHAGRIRTAPPVGTGTARGPVVGGGLARGLRRPRRRPGGVADLRGGVLPVGSPRPGQQQRHLAARPNPVCLRHRGPEEPLPAPHGLRRRDLGPGVVGAQRRQRPGGYRYQGHPRRRVVRPGRPKDLVFSGGLGRLAVLHRADRPVGRAPPRPVIPAGSGGLRGLGPPPGGPAGRRAGVRRAVLRSVPGARVQPAGRRGPGLERGHGHHV